MIDASKREAAYIAVIAEPKADHDCLGSDDAQKCADRCHQPRGCQPKTGTYGRLSTRTAGIRRPIPITNDAILEATMSTRRCQSPAITVRSLTYMTQTEEV